MDKNSVTGLVLIMGMLSELNAADDARDMNIF